ncbi:hypothetical protein F444_06111 [Phytophthora nicotianae P1976]|uniref:Uncharacterized protein n=1 Tax=Phytophthora nicotianae P1976 TaxID=1317066 RepID=A0A081AJR8_PHYNI|nr:hypothetical protein F444_06111 [Phytophthora nicotianae P1976]
MLISSAGNSFTVGGNHRIPIEDNGDVKMKITDTNQNEGEVNAVGDDFKINSPAARNAFGSLITEQSSKPTLVKQHSPTSFK